MLWYIFVLLTLLSAFFINKIQSYWSRQGVPEIPPQFFTGNVIEIVTYKKNWGQLILEFYNEFNKKGLKYGGIYFFIKPTFLPLDPKIIKDILVTNFDSFVNRGVYYNKEYEPISANIVAIENKQWKSLRHDVLPTFTSSQLSSFFESFITQTNKLKTVLAENCSKNRSLDVRKLAASFTTDIIVSCLYGNISNCITDHQSKYFEYGNKITEITWQKSLTLILAQLFPRKVCGLLGMRFTDIEVEDFFLNMVKSSINNGKKMKGNGKDMIDVMLDAVYEKNTNNCKPESRYGVDEIAAQCFVAFIAGYETTATVLKFSLYELAVNQHVQNILNNEIQEVLRKNNGKVSFETVSEMEYLHGAILETLRIHPVCPVLLRSCNTKYKVPGTNVTLDKGTLVNIPVLGLHMDPKYHPNPEKFIPDRFSKENKKLIQDFTFMPFGAGPRGCLGYRFGFLTIKAAIIEIIRDYEISLCEKTKLPVELTPNSFFVTTKNPIWIKLKRRKIK